MSAKEYNVWLAEYAIEPWGQDRDDIRSGMIVQSIRAQNSKEGVILKDCILNFEPPKKNKNFDWKAASAACRSHTLAMGGKVG